MARCCGNTCSCRLVAGVHLALSGTGTTQDPFVISSDVALGVVDTPSIDFTLTGTGTAADPWNITAALSSTSKLDHLGDVVAPGPTSGQVLGWNGTAWVPQAATTAAAGTVTTSTSIHGDGSGGSPLAVTNSAAGGLIDTGAGEQLTDAIFNQLVRRFASAAARAAALPAPVLNSLSMRDDAPGAMDWYNGATYSPLLWMTDIVSLSQLVALSGAYAGSPGQLMVKQVSVTSDAAGVIHILDAIDLTGYAGVLSCTFQETGPAIYKAVVTPGSGVVDAVAYRLDTGAPLVSTLVTGTAVAWLY